jgi:hypothetical protein
MYNLEGYLGAFRGERERKTMGFAQLTPMTLSKKEKSRKSG